MKNKKIKISYFATVLLLGFVVLLTAGFIGDDVTRSKNTPSIIYKSSEVNQGGKYGDSYRMNINNLNIPMNRSGVIADVNIAPGGAGGRFGGQIFLFSSGFFLTGLSNGTVFSNAVASASLVRDYLPGPVGKSNDADAVMYVIKASDPAFGPAWQDWRDAVEMGADFYDGDGDGVYNPVDKNGNGVWDPDEDAPDFLGDETVWCVYNDGVPGAQRRWNQVDPLGIEVKQTVFALQSKGAVGNMMFVRYRIKYVGLGAANEPEKLDSCFFGVWADPDLGNPDDDLVGCDVAENAAYTYNFGPDNTYGQNPPCYMIDFFSGPLEYIPGVTFNDVNGNGMYDDGLDEPLDTAYSIRGRRIGIIEYPGARNQPLSSVVEYLNGFSVEFNDPDNHLQARNYSLGLQRGGGEVDPCTLPIGEVRGGVDCNTVDPRFWFSGDPVTEIGWIGTQPWDVRQMSNTGPFTLFKGEEKEIVVAYVVGRGTDAYNSITVAREIDVIAQQVFDSNFPSPPAPPAIPFSMRSGENFIDLTIETSTAMNYRAIDTVLDVDRWIQGFYVNQFRINDKAGSVQGVKNIEFLGSYGINNGIEAIYRVSSNGGQDLALASPEKVLDSVLLANPETGRIKLRLRQDALTNTPFVKGREYYFTITQYTLNHNAIVNRATGTYGGPGDYLDITSSGLEEFETAIIAFTFGSNMYDPAVDNSFVNPETGASDGRISYLAVDRDQMTGHDYLVQFFTDKTAPATAQYSPYWRLTNETTNTVLIDSSKVYDFDTTNYAGKLTDGFLLKVRASNPSFNATDLYEPLENKWYSRFLPTEGTGIYYVGQDISQGSANTLFGSAARSNVIRADRLRRVEIRFGEQGIGKAYRYLNGYIGANFLQQTQSHRYAGGITEADTVGKGPVGLLGQGYVDVPFTAWVVDTKYNEERQLAVGFIERRGTGSGFFGTPDGIWDPGDSLKFTREVIVVFDAPYDPAGGQIEYTGGSFTTGSGTSTVWADPIRGFTIPADAQGITENQRRIAASPWFNALYVVGLDREEGQFITPGDKFIIRMSNYPYTDLDRFKFTTPKGSLTAEEKRALFDRVNVFPNPLYGYNVATSYTNSPADEPFVTFSNLPEEEITVKIYSLSGNLLRTLTKEAGGAPFLNWNLLNESGLRVASGLYLAIVSSQSYGDKVLKFSIIMPQKQLPRY